MIRKQALVIDDDIHTRILLKDILTLKGFSVVLSQNGLEALEQLETIKPAIILLDLMMPTMDGYAFLEVFQSHPLRPSTPILVLTADVNAAKDLSHLAVEGTMLKPFHLGSLLALISQFLIDTEKTEAEQGQ